jgi:hypothetical protein
MSDVNQEAKDGRGLPLDGFERNRFFMAPPPPPFAFQAALIGLGLFLINLAALAAGALIYFAWRGL